MEGTVLPQLEMERALWLGKGVLAKSNAEVVEKIIRIAREFGIEPAAPLVLGGRVVRRSVLYLGEINGSQREAWRKTIEVWENGAVTAQTMALINNSDISFLIAQRARTPIGVLQDRVLAPYA